MKIDEFIRKYNSAKDKEKFLAGCIKKTYIPYHEKVADCQRIINATMESDGVFRVNTPAQFMIFTVNVISKYADIEYDDVLTTFEKLDELNLINGIISHIPEREYSTYNTLLSMTQDDYMENNRNFISFIETKVKALGLSMDAILEVIQKYVPQDVPEMLEEAE